MIDGSNPMKLRLDKTSNSFCVIVVVTVKTNQSRCILSFTRTSGLDRTTFNTSPHNCTSRFRSHVCSASTAFSAHLINRPMLCSNKSSLLCSAAISVCKSLARCYKSLRYNHKQTVHTLRASGDPRSSYLRWTWWNKARMHMFNFPSSSKKRTANSSRSHSVDWPSVNEIAHFSGYLCFCFLWKMLFHQCNGSDVLEWLYHDEPFRSQRHVRRHCTDMPS